MTIDLTQIILAIITLVGGIVVRYLIPYLKEKTTNEQQQLLSQMIDIGVYSAEQIYTGTGLGAEKKRYVKDLLQQAGYDVDLAEVNAAIEAAVKGLKIELSKQ